jgi:hypothetical protein
MCQNEKRLVVLYFVVTDAGDMSLRPSQGRKVARSFVSWSSARFMKVHIESLTVVALGRGCR